MQPTRPLECAVTNSPKHLVQASLSVPLIKQKLFASMDLQYVSKRATLAGQYSGAYAVPNFTLFSRNIVKGWEISASLYNAFNQKYADPAGNGLRRTLSFRMAELSNQSRIQIPMMRYSSRKIVMTGNRVGSSIRCQD